MKLYTVLISYIKEGTTNEHRVTFFIVSSWLTEATDEATKRLFRSGKIEHQQEISSLHAFEGRSSVSEDPIKEAKQVLRAYATAATTKNRPYKWDSLGLASSKSVPEATRIEIESLQRMAGIRK